MKLTKKMVMNIKQQIIDKVPQPRIASTYGVSRSVISDIATDRRHKDVPWPGDRSLKKPGGQRKVIDYDPTNERVLELESEVVMLTEERNKEKIKVKAGAKVTGLFKAIVQEMDTRIKPYTSLPNLYRPTKKDKIIEHCVMHLSDGHHDQVVRPEMVGGLEN